MVLRMMRRLFRRPKKSDTSVEEDSTSRNEYYDAQEFDYLEGLRAAGASTPPLEGANEEDIEVQADEEVVKRVSFVEAKLMDLVIEEFDHEDEYPEVHPQSSVKSSQEKLPFHKPHSYPCADTFKTIPSPPSKWAQAPIMLRPTPGSNMKIRGIRYSNSPEYSNFSGFCAGCILPVNTGKEKPGRSIVIDFESKYFVGTIMVRIKDAKPVKADENYQEESYFDNKKRRFQVVVKGRFKEPLPMSECVTGQAFDRHAGKLPAGWIVHAFIRFISTLAPQLEASFGDKPRFLTPLVATAHTVQVKDYAVPAHVVSTAHDENDERLVNYKVYAGSSDMESDVAEPPLDDNSNLLTILSKVDKSSGKSVAACRAVRKKVFNAIAANREAEPTFDTEKEYTFEFYQHLLLLTSPEEFQIDALHSKIGLTQMLNGQPIKILAAHKDFETGELSPLWSFDIWHESLYNYAQANYGETEES